jgi:hypothetical protein
MIHAYLDLNVFDRIEKKNNLEEDQRNTFSRIEHLILDGEIICPYSNAHINDLLRGYAKSSAYISRHLETIERLTKNLCIIQFWGNNQATWLYRDIEEFFNSALEDKEVTLRPFTELMDWDETGLAKSYYELLSVIPVPLSFKEIYNANPIFNLIFPRTKTKMNVLAMCEDLYDFSNNLKKDYSLYKSLRSFYNTGRAKLIKQHKLLTVIDKSMSELPAYLNHDAVWEKYAPKIKSSNNPAYQTIINTYFKIDFKGYKSDEKFPNLSDDALHVFYGAHCDYFVTLDDNCHYKAAETYHKLGITTIAAKPTELLSYLAI